MEKTKKVVVNRCLGGFSLSALARLAYLQLRENTNNIYTYKYDLFSSLSSNKNAVLVDIESIADDEICLIFTKTYYGEYIQDFSQCDEIEIDFEELFREDPILVKVIETLGNKADVKHSSLEVVEIPEDVEYYIDNRDGCESIHENHRVW